MLQNLPLRKYLVLFSIVLLIRCGNDQKIDGLDSTLWSKDKFGCSGIRSGYIKTIEASRNNLLQLNQNEVEKLLGAPDEHELDKRKRKYYYYYLEPAMSCDNGIEYPVKLQIKFNALGLSSEVFIENN